MQSIKIGSKFFDICTDDAIGWENNFTLVDFNLFSTFLNGKTVLDIGANVGLTSILFAQVSENVFAFEPSLNSFRNLSINIQSSKYSNVHLYRFGLGSRNENRILATTPGISTTAHVLTNNTHSEFQQEIIQIKKLDKVYKSIGVSNVKFVKIDVEGHELEVIAGALKHLEFSGWPPIIFESWDFDWFKDKRHALLKYLHFIGYENISQDIGYQNYLAQHTKTHSKIIEIEIIGTELNININD
jgi:FkbM family methyltransferase